MSITSVTYSQLVEFNALEQRRQPEILYDVTGGYNKLFFFLEYLNVATGRVWEPKYRRIYDVYQMEHEWPSAQVVGVTVSGGDVVVTLPAGVDGRIFRRNDIVDNGIETDLKFRGHVKSSTQSTVIIAPIPGFSTTTTLLQAFSGPGALIRVGGRSDELKGSGNADNWHIEPKKWTNMCMIVRDGFEMNNDDARRTIFDRVSGLAEAYTLMHGPTVLRRMLTVLEENMLWGKFNNNYVVNNSTYGQSQGLFHSIIDQGGAQLQLSGPLTQSAFESFINTLAAKRSDFSGEYVAILGRSMMATIAGFYGTQIQFSAPAITTLDGGAVKLRLDVGHLTLPSTVKVKFLVANAFSDTKRNPRMTTIPGLSGLMRENMIFILDMDNVTDAVTGQQLPAFELVSFDGKPFYFGSVRGIRDGASAMTPEQVKASFSVADVNTVVDKREYSILFDGGWNFHRGWSSGVIYPKN